MTAEPVVHEATGPYQFMPLMTAEQYEELKADIRVKGVLQPIEFDERGVIVDGYHRFRAWCELIEEGVDIPVFPRIDRVFANEQDKVDHVISLNVKRRHLTAEQRQQLAFQLRKPPFSYSMTRIAQLLGVTLKTIWYDLDDLSDAEKAELKDIEIKGLDSRTYTTDRAPKLVFTTGEKQLLQAHSKIEGAKAEEADLTKAEQFQETWKVSVGDVWVVPSKSAPGENHVLHCGNSMLPGFWNGYGNGTWSEASMLWTDPPYGVGYTGKTQDALTFENDRLDEAGLTSLLRAAFMNVQIVSEDSAPFYIAHPPGPLSWVFGDVLRALEWRMHETLVWIKDSMVLGHSDYHLKHEPIYYGWMPGEGGRPGRGAQEGSKWYGTDNQVSVFEVARPKRSLEHPTMKPTDLIVQHIRNSSPWKGTVVDPFAGSFSTAAAAEEAGRVCVGVELDPANVAIGLERLQAMGLTPVRA